MKFKIMILISAILLSACASSGAGNGHGYVTSVPQVVMQDSMFRVNIQRVNGKQPIDSRQYQVPAGEATIRVSLILDRNYAPQLVSAVEKIFTQELTFNVTAGVTYQVGAKVDLQASGEDQMSGNFWEPVIYREN